MKCARELRRAKALRVLIDTNAPILRYGRARDERLLERLRFAKGAAWLAEQGDCNRARILLRFAAQRELRSPEDNDRLERMRGFYGARE